MSIKREFIVQTEGCSRRQLMRTVACAIGGIAIAAASTPAQAKMSQKAAAYQTGPKGSENCANCALFKAPASCTLIDGNVVQTGWCRYYSKK